MVLEKTPESHLDCKEIQPVHSKGDQMQDTGCLGLVHWDDPEGRYREGGRRGARHGFLQRVKYGAPEKQGR